MNRFRPVVRLIFLALIALGGYLLADMSNLFIAERLEDSMPFSSTSIRKTRRDSIPSQRESYQSIVQKNLFDPTMGIYVPPAPIPVVYQPPPPPPPPPPALPPPVVPPKAPLNVQLVGTVVHPDSPSYAVIQDNRTRRQLIYRVGDYLLDDAKITKIERNRVIVEREGERIVLEIALSPVSTPIAPASRAPGIPSAQPDEMPPQFPRNRGIRQVSDNQWVMDRSEIDYAVEHLPEIMTKARVVPNFVDGKSTGFRIFAIQEDSIYAKIGLQNGDILKRINHVDVRDPQNFLQVFQQLKDEPRITVEFVRNTEEKTFNYTIR